MKKKLCVIGVLCAVLLCGCGANSNDGKCDKCGAEDVQKYKGAEYCTTHYAEALATELAGALGL